MSYNAHSNPVNEETQKAQRGWVTQLVNGRIKTTQICLKPKH